MQIIKIRPEIVKKIGEELVAELSKGIPEERMASIHEIAEIACQIKDRAEDAKAIPLKLVEQFNRLCYKLFPEEQDGAEFEKKEVTEQPKMKAMISQPMDGAEACVSSRYRL